MITLALDTATSHPSVAVLEDRKLLADEAFESPFSLTRHLLPVMDRLLGSLKLAVSDLNGLAVSIGPGSFTGLRVGLATMSALRLALKIPLVGVSTLEGLAWNVPPTALPILSTVYIKPGTLYFGHYIWQGEEIVCLGDERMGTVPEALERVHARTLVVGDGWSRNLDLFSQLNGNLVSPKDNQTSSISAPGIGLAGYFLLQRGRVLPEEFSPRYLQLSYAESHPARKEEEHR
jgi:tRNA threonylcarbamoyladenosine biosynthesis protein TsaB